MTPSLFSTSFKTATLVVAGALLSRLGQAQAPTVSTVIPTLQAWTAIDFLTPTTGVVGGAHGTFAITTSSGVRWRVDSVRLSTRPIVAVKMVAADTLLVVTEDAVLLSADTGYTWQSNPIPYATAGQRAFLVGNKQIWISSKGYSGALLRTLDGGATWDSLRVDPRSRMSFYGLYANGRGMVVGAGGNFEASNRGNAIYRSMNDGLTWDSINFSRQGTLNDFNQLFDLSFGNDSVGYAVGAKNIIYRTVDGGLNWNLITQSDNSQPYLRTAFAKGPDTLITLGDAGYGRSGYYSRSGGLVLQPLLTQWPATSLRNAQRVSCIWFGQGVGYAATAGGQVLRFTVQSLGWVVGLKKGVPHAPITLYPNPATVSQTFAWEGAPSQANVSVFDATGRLVSTKAVVPARPGVYTVRLNYGSTFNYTRLVVE